MPSSAKNYRGGKSPDDEIAALKPRWQQRMARWSVAGWTFARDPWRQAGERSWIAIPPGKTGEHLFGRDYIWAPTLQRLVINLGPGEPTLV